MRVMIVLGLVLLSALSTSCQRQEESSGLYFGQTAPVDIPAVFAPGVVSKEDRFEQFLLFSPDGSSLTFCVTDSAWSMFTLHVMNLVNGRWTDPVAAPFLGSDPSGLTSCMSFEMDRAYFTTARPSYPPCDIWMNKRVDATWAEPTKLGPSISSDADEFEVAISRKGTLYFSSNRPGGLGDMDIYRARLVDGGYPAAENLGPAINTSSGDDVPYIAPDESYLIFASDRPEGLGERDLYISFQVDGAWTKAQNLGSPINSEYFDIYPSLSPDGTCLFFTRRQSWITNEDSDIYWVDAGFIDRLRANYPRR